ncbi:MAG: chemotaxis-specific protein-glutamate methyltransferase CheB [Bryobacterales bacterium]|nr:chemotaxis-specific protein-glutamate methyltransferase CheB [Bryobacterales bacterium]
MRRIRVLVVDDSPFVCRLVSGYFSAEPDMEVIGNAHSGREAIDKTRTLRPDVVTLDLEMPGTGGLAALESIMQECPTPVVALSGVSGGAARQTLQALELGAVDFVLKFTPGVRLSPEQIRREVIAKVRSAAHTRVVRLRRRQELPGLATASRPIERAPALAATLADGTTGLVIIGASTGGPLAVRDLVTQLPANFRYCVIIVQHMPAGFTSVLATQLDNCCALPVREAKEGDPLRAAQVYVAPGGFHLEITPRLTVGLRTGTESGGYCPSIDVAMESAARVLGRRAKGIVMTGMGDDGSRGLKAIRDAGGETFAQDIESCVIGSMPQNAVDRGAVGRSGAPKQLAGMIGAEVLIKD